MQTSLDNHPNEKYRKIFLANYHPGFVKTSISSKEEYKALKIFSVPVNMIVNTFAISAPEGAKTGLFLATCPLEGKPRGSFWNEKTQPQSVGKQAEDAKLRRCVDVLLNLPADAFSELIGTDVSKMLELIQNHSLSHLFKQGILFINLLLLISPTYEPY